MLPIEIEGKILSIRERLELSKCEFDRAMKSVKLEIESALKESMNGRIHRS